MKPPLISHPVGCRLRAVALRFYASRQNKKSHQTVTVRNWFNGSWLTGSWLYAIFTSMSCLHALHRNGICCTLVSCRTGKRDFPQCGQQYHVLPLISFIILSLKREKGATVLRLPFPVVWFFGRRGVLLHLSGCPCQYHRRVDATKLSTSKNYFYLSKAALSNFSCSSKSTYKKNIGWLRPERHSRDLFCPLPCGMRRMTTRFPPQSHTIYPMFIIAASLFFVNAVLFLKLEGATRRQPLIDWLLGRRSLLLRPFWPSWRVVATKSTTSSNLFYSTFIIRCLSFFVNLYRLSPSMIAVIIEFSRPGSSPTTARRITSRP